MLLLLKKQLLLKMVLMLLQELLLLLILMGELELQLHLGWQGKRGQRPLGGKG